MSDGLLHQYERDAEYARAKLTHDLSRLKRPAAASEAAQHFIDKAGEKAQSAASNLVEELKAKAAANPIAALAIGAGIGWRLIRNPPIATALVGAGLVSLLRTPTPEAAAHDDFDPVRTGVDNLKAQVQDAATTAYARAEDLGDAVRTRVGKASAAAGERLQAATQGMQEKGQALADSMTARAKAFSATTSDQVAAAKRSVGDAAAAVNEKLSTAYRASAAQASDAKDHIGEAADVARNVVVERAGKIVSAAHDMDSAVQDRILLGIAGTAVALALGLAWQSQSGRREDA